MKGGEEREGGEGERRRRRGGGGGGGGGEEGGEPLLTLPAKCGKKSPRQASSTCRILKRSRPGGGCSGGGRARGHARGARAPRARGKYKTRTKRELIPKTDRQIDR